MLPDPSDGFVLVAVLRVSGASPVGENLTGHNRGGSCRDQASGVKGTSRGIEGNVFHTCMEVLWSLVPSSICQARSKLSNRKQRQKILQCFFELCGKPVNAERDFILLERYNCMAQHPNCGLCNERPQNGFAFADIIAQNTGQWLRRWLCTFGTSKYLKNLLGVRSLEAIKFMPQNGHECARIFKVGCFSWRPLMTQFSESQPASSLMLSKV